MKKIDCIQQYVIDKLIDDKKLSTGRLINAMSYDVAKFVRPQIYSMSHLFI